MLPCRIQHQVGDENSTLWTPGDTPTDQLSFPVMLSGVNREWFLRTGTVVAAPSSCEGFGADNTRVRRTAGRCCLLLAAMAAYACSFAVAFRQLSALTCLHCPLLLAPADAVCRSSAVWRSRLALTLWAEAVARRLSARSLEWRGEGRNRERSGGLEPNRPPSCTSLSCAGDFVRPRNEPGAKYLALNKALCQVLCRATSAPVADASNLSGLLRWTDTLRCPFDGSCSCS
mmetsp:Transcript_21781/g.43846  ORF Transcript_21781/g.43846 Transcript_21781/m.43846 type:complete len:230 (-) Transcript_21781:846-1535(-)